MIFVVNTRIIIVGNEAIIKADMAVNVELLLRYVLLVV